MAADFFFDKPTFEIQSLRPVAVFKWRHLNSPEVQYAIAAEEQYLHFHRYMIENIRHTEAGKLEQPPYSYKLGLSVRAGAIKAAILIAASIAEAALRAIAEIRSYPLNKEPRKRTFGNVIRAWEQNGIPRPEVSAIWPNVIAIHEVRNFVHLHKAAEEADASWENVLKEENNLLNSALEAIEHIAKIKP